MHRFIYPVILPADPAQPLEAATKQYVDAQIGSSGIDLSVADARYINVTGDTMTGSLALASNPTTALQAATKQYVDDSIAAIPPSSGYTPPTRTTRTITTTSLAVSATATGTVNLGKAYRLYKIQTSAPCRTRLYTTTAKRDADVTRPIGTAPAGDHGLMFEFVSDSTLLLADLSPVVDGFDNDTDGLIPYSIVNISTGATSFTVTFTYIVTES